MLNAAVGVVGVDSGKRVCGLLLPTRSKCCCCFRCGGGGVFEPLLVEDVATESSASDNFFVVDNGTIDFFVIFRSFDDLRSLVEVVDLYLATAAAAAAAAADPAFFILVLLDELSAIASCFELLTLVLLEIEYRVDRLRCSSSC